MDRPHGPLVRAVVGLERLQRGAARIVAVAEDAREAGPGGLVGRDRVRLLLVVELDAVLDRSQEAVRSIELGGFSACDVAALRERVQRVERRR